MTRTFRSARVRNFCGEQGTRVPASARTCLLLFICAVASGCASTDQEASGSGGAGASGAMSVGVVHGSAGAGGKSASSTGTSAAGGNSGQAAGNGTTGTAGTSSSSTSETSASSAGNGAGGPGATASNGSGSGGKSSSANTGAGGSSTSETSAASSVTGAGGPGATTSGSGAGGSGGGDPAGLEQCTKRAAVNAATWKLAWADEFAKDGPPDPASWGFEKGFVRNQELQWYQTNNASVANGLLTIAAQREQVLNPNYVAGSTDWKKSRQYAAYTSSSINTSGKHSFTYGRFEICARIDTRQGSWPAFWMLGSGVGWPQSGEVDIMEYYANKVLANVCEPSGSTCNWDSTNQSLSSLGGATWSGEFHLWAMEWDAQNINLYLDDKVTNQFSVPSAVGAGQTNPYIGKSAYMLVNMAVGANGGDPANTTFPLKYEVDYVRVYQHP
jgi:beta-glucanase (GH16 family)